MVRATRIEVPTTAPNLAMSLVSSTMTNTCLDNEVVPHPRVAQNAIVNTFHVDRQNNYLSYRAHSRGLHAVLWCV